MPEHPFNALDPPGFPPVVSRSPDAPVDRRAFLKVAAGLVVLPGVSVQNRTLWASIAPAGDQFAERVEYELSIDPLGVSFSGESAEARSISGMIPGPLLRLREGQEAVIRVTNNLEEQTSLHWHGLLVPFDMDGVPGFSFSGIAPGETFTYRFQVGQAGTYWYHSHSGGQEQQGVYAPIVIDPEGEDPVQYDREHVLVLSDWTDEDPLEVLRNLKGNAAYYNYGKRTVPGFFKELFNDAGATIRDRHMWGRMRMDPTDIADVTGATYTYLLNGQNAEQNWTGLFQAGERVRLRIINAAAMTYYDLKIPGLPMTVIQSDGQDVEPVTVDELPIAVAETYDVIVEPQAGQAYTIFAQTLDRSGFARGTLAEREGVEAPIPPMTARTLRSMQMDGMDMAGMDMPAMDMPPMDMPAPPAIDTTAAMPMDTTAAMPMDHAAAGHEAMAGASMVLPRLEYSHLRALTPNPDVRDPETDMVFRLTGDMERYFWTLNDKKLSDSEPIQLVLGERVRVQFINETMMEHPMHLHGVFMELQNGQERAYAPRKHTINVPPSETVEAHLTFEAAGPWALHCHLLFHMMTGMFARVEVSDRVAETEPPR
jgi:CopA family copper-resistance protein